MKSFALVGCLWAAVSVGCATETVDLDRAPAEEATTEVGQAMTGDPLCDGWTACYAFCRRLYQCTNPTRCALQLTCLTNCDSSYYPAPAYCPYPE